MTGPKYHGAARWLTFWTVYRRPRDFPGQFVVRRHFVLEDGSTRPDADAILAETLEAARAALPPGLVNLGRMAADDPVITEVWI